MATPQSRTREGPRSDRAPKFNSNSKTCRQLALDKRVERLAAVEGEGVTITLKPGWTFEPRPLDPVHTMHFVKWEEARNRVRRCYDCVCPSCKKKIVAKMFTDA